MPPPTSHRCATSGGRSREAATATASKGDRSGPKAHHLGISLIPSVAPILWRGAWARPPSATTPPPLYVGVRDVFVPGSAPRRAAKQPLGPKGALPGLQTRPKPSTAKLCSGRSPAIRLPSTAPQRSALIWGRGSWVSDRVPRPRANRVVLRKGVGAECGLLFRSLGHF